MGSPSRAGSRPASFQSSPSSSAVPDGYFAALALRAGYVGVGDDVRGAQLLREQVSAGESLQRELLKERIRREIIAREMVQVRILEEEVRRELEIDRMWAMRRRQEEMNSSFGGPPARLHERVPLTHFAPGIEVEKRAPPNLSPVVKNSAAHQLQNFEGKGKFSLLLPDVKTDGRKDYLSTPRDPHFVELSPVVQNSAVHQLKDFEGKGKVSLLLPDVDSLKFDHRGIKRKASEIPGKGKSMASEPADRDWSCALCQVTATCREALNEHLQGKKHKAKAESMAIIRKFGTSTSVEGVKKSFKVARGKEPKNSRVDTEGKNSSIRSINLLPVQKQQKTASLRCELCKVECNSNSVLACHLGGKKHKNKLAKFQVAINTTGGDGKTAVEMHSIKTANEVKDKSPSTDEGTGIVEDVEKEGQKTAKREEGAQC